MTKLDAAAPPSSTPPTWAAAAGVRYTGGPIIAVDGAGSAYVTGITASPDFPTTAGAFDDDFGRWRTTRSWPSSTRPVGLGYSTFLGGSRRRRLASRSTAWSCLRDRFHRSTDFPTTPGAFDETYNGGGDAFVTKLDVSGAALVYSTYLGGSGAERVSESRSTVPVGRT